MASSSSQVLPSISGNSNVGENDLNCYLPLHKAAIRGDWESASKFFDSNPDAVSARITKNLETVLHIAVGRSEASSFVEKLVELMPTDALSLKTKFSETALHYAAKYGNIKAAKYLVVSDPGLPHIWNDTNLLPLHLAALFGHKEMVLFLLTVTRDNEVPNAFEDQPGITLLISIVHSAFYDVALDLVRKYPKLATTISPGNNTALSILAGKPSAFLSGRSLRSWEKLIYSCIPVKLARTSHLRRGRDIENPSERHIKQTDVCWQVLRQTFRRTYPGFVWQKLYTRFWDVIGGIVPRIKHIHDMKLMHCQAMELVKCLCLESVNVDTVKSASIFKPAVISSATCGLYEVIEEILSSFPSAIWCLDPEHHDLFQIAVMNRRETIFNLLYDLEEHAHLVTQNTDSHNNNILHLAGKLAPPHRLSIVSGAALQMQRELQWYKEVENFVTPSYKGKENTDGKTPAMVFAEEHKDLIVEAEEWLKDTAKSCTFAATLIATVVFAAAITVPGGSSTESGLPIFQKQRPFVVFAVSNAVSLFSSVTSVLMFLFILTSRCAEADFLYMLPNTLIIGLVNLFLSLASMMLAFSSAMYAVFGHNRTWFLAPLTLVACLPVTLFLFLQYPLLKDMIRSTYGPGIFGKKRRSIFSKSGNRSV
ncbi:uncharacterized protein LOC110011228 isoform X2 [Sesamum indicum]|uniref:Uncharacterized protein LOC110011228 isoform X2 n=1 Tax=Sesamum indicum TaxID=4182 RepID=A0A8M8VBW9_SESIN|nr:uncharacterized protein LOC110011228 isoform X2 [Sesamum indicum]